MTKQEDIKRLIEIEQKVKNILYKIEKSKNANTSEKKSTSRLNDLIIKLY